MALAIDDCTFAVVDVETTGIDARHDRIVEVAVVTCNPSGAVQERFETLVHPVEASLTAERAEMLAGAPTFADVAGDILARFPGRVLAGHNVTFDLRFLNSELSRLGLRLPTQPFVCTRELATLLGCDVANRTLAALCVYFDIPFDRWHTAGDDAVATVEVLARLLARATGFGRLDLASVASRWPGSSTEWPELRAQGKALARDVARWPPTGDQPGGRRATEPSFRRLGDGPPSLTRAYVVEVLEEPGGPDPDWNEPESGEPGEPGEPDPTRTSATALWWRGDFRGLEGIALLTDVVVPTFRVNRDPELADALIALADLLRRHGGRDAEVRATFDEAFNVVIRRGDRKAIGGGRGLARVVDEWWSYLSALRDTDGQVALMVRCLDAGDEWGLHPIEKVIDQVARSRGSEPIVAEHLARQAMASLRERGDECGTGRVLVALAQAFDVAGRGDEATALIEKAWVDGLRSLAVLDRLSARLEAAGQYERAADACARALTGPRVRPGHAGPEEPSLLDGMRKRHRRCQERMARAATLFSDLGAPDAGVRP